MTDTLHPVRAQRDLFAMFAALLSLVATSVADSIAIDWYGGGKNEGTSQARMARSEWAGAVPQQHWNSFPGPKQATGLVDNQGAPGRCQRGDGDLDLVEGEGI